MLDTGRHRVCNNRRAILARRINRAWTYSRGRSGLAILRVLSRRFPLPGFEAVRPFPHSRIPCFAPRNPRPLCVAHAPRTVSPIPRPVSAVPTRAARVPYRGPPLLRSAVLIMPTPAIAAKRIPRSGVFQIARQKTRTHQPTDDPRYGAFQIARQKTRTHQRSPRYGAFKFAPTDPQRRTVLGMAFFKLHAKSRGPQNRRSSVRLPPPIPNS